MWNLTKVLVLLENYKIDCQDKHFLQSTNHLLHHILTIEISFLPDLTMNVFQKLESYQYKAAKIQKIHQKTLHIF